MGATFNRVKTWIAEVLTSSDLNAEFDNILNNFTPAGMDDASVNLAAMRTQRDVTGASLATDGAEEFHGLRFQFDSIIGKDYWYEAADTSLLLQFNKGADIASATALALGTDGNYFDVTGTTTMTSIGTRRVGDPIRLHFDGALILTHHATDLILPTAANITTVAGDEATFYEYATGDWRCINYQRASGQALDTTDGSIVQSVHIADGTVNTGTTVFPVDNTIPQNTEGDQYMSLGITPVSATNKLVIDAALYGAHTASDSTMSMALFQDATANALAASIEGLTVGANAMGGISLRYEMVAGTTSPIDFKIRAGSLSAGTFTFNGASAAVIFGGVMASYIRITEHKV